MSDTVSVNDLSDSDVVADVAALIDGVDDVDGIEIYEVEYDDDGLTITLADADGNTRPAHFRYRPSA